MENNNDINKEMINRSGKVWAGLFIIAVGSLLLLDNVGLNLPHWLFSWSTFLIVVGLFIGLKHRFRHGGWIAPMLVGIYFTLQDALGTEFDFSRVTLPIILVVIGLFLILKPKNRFRHERWGRRGRRWRNRFDQPETFQSYTAEEPVAAERKAYANDFIDSVNVFGGSHQTVYSKNFKGGDIVAVFGGCDLNLTQADFEGEVVIDITAIFGGTKIVIPPGWIVKQEMTAIFGGVDDKRSVQPHAEGPTKIVVIKGIAMFGGVDIRNF